jgi:hypothetical protein
MADNTAARMTAFKPGASPPPVQIAIRLMFTAEVGIGYSLFWLFVGRIDQIVLYIKYIVNGSFRVKSQPNRNAAPRASPHVIPINFLSANVMYRQS